MPTVRRVIAQIKTPPKRGQVEAGILLLAQLDVLY